MILMLFLGWGNFENSGNKRSLTKRVFLLSLFFNESFETMLDSPGPNRMVCSFAIRLLRAVFAVVFTRILARLSADTIVLSTLLAVLKADIVVCLNVSASLNANTIVFTFLASLSAKTVAFHNIMCVASLCTDILVFTTSLPS